LLLPLPAVSSCARDTPPFSHNVAESGRAWLSPSGRLNSVDLDPGTHLVVEGLRASPRRSRSWFPLAKEGAPALRTAPFRRPVVFPGYHVFPTRVPPTRRSAPARYLIPIAGERVPSSFRSRLTLRAPSPRSRHILRPRGQTRTFPPAASICRWCAGPDLDEPNRPQSSRSKLFQTFSATFSGRFVLEASAANS